MAKRKKTEKRLTKRERKELYGRGPSGTQKKSAEHIHCVACGRHLNAGEFSGAAPTAKYVTCEHQSRFASCTKCVDETQRRLDEHDRSGRAVQTAAAWH